MNVQLGRQKARLPAGLASACTYLCEVMLRILLIYWHELCLARRASAARIGHGSLVLHARRSHSPTARPRPGVFLIPPAPRSQWNEPDRTTNSSCNVALDSSRARKMVPPTLWRPGSLSGVHAQLPSLSQACGGRGILGPMVMVSVPVFHLGHLRQLPGKKLTSREDNTSVNRVDRRGHCVMKRFCCNG